MMKLPSLGELYYSHHNLHRKFTTRLVHVLSQPLLFVALLAALRRLPLPSALLLPAALGDASRVAAAAYLLAYFAAAPLVALSFLPPAALLMAVASRASLPAAAALAAAAVAADLAAHARCEPVAAEDIRDGLAVAVLGTPLAVWLDAVFLIGAAPRLQQRLMRFVRAKDKEKLLSKEKQSD